MSTLKSKKFIAYLIAEIGWKVLIFTVVYKIGDTLSHQYLILLLTLVVVSAFIQVGYILGQAALDKYVYLGKAALKDKDDSK